MAESRPENDFERESSRLNEGLKTCRAVMENYRAMIAGEQPEADKESDVTGYVSATGNAQKVYESDPAAN